MIRSGAIPEVAFGTAADGDARSDTELRDAVFNDLGAPTDWATISQVHGPLVRVAAAPEHLGEADGLITQTPGLSLCVATADCLPIALSGERTVALVHAGWRGIVSGVIPTAITAMRELGDAPHAVSIGPHIGPCCYEVGDEVIDALGGHASSTRWGTQSANLAAAALAQIGAARIPATGVEVSGICNMDDLRFNSFRRDGTMQRQVTVAWLPVA
ncbi:MAG: polyphenol oxidase family protein [Acidimicrobiia bacterium]